MKLNVPAVCLCLSTVSTTVLAGNNIVLRTFRSLVTARIDPVVASGQVSQHSHHVIGGNRFSSVYNPDELRKSKCSTLPIQADKSNYWYPQIFKIQADGSFIGMQTGTRVYYLLGENLAPGTKIEPFPYNFQMVWGDPGRKTYNGSDLFDFSNGYYCEKGDSSSFGSPTLPTQPCKVLIMKVFMPCCWSGQPYDPENPTAHMRYPNGWWDGRDCPASHPRRFPSMLIESFHFNADMPNNPPNGTTQYILANGDTTGYGLHADFQNGWDQKVLQGYIDNCRYTSTPEPPSQGCPYLKPFENYTMGDSCEYDGLIPDESVGWLNNKPDPLPKLPGCNPIWSSGPKPGCLALARNRATMKTLQWIKSKIGTVYP